MGNSFVIPVPLSVNNLYYNVGKARRMTDKAKAYKEEVFWITKMWAAENQWVYEEGSVALSLNLTFPNKIRRDITNCIKISEDAVSMALDFDDTNCREFIVSLVGYDKENPRAIFTVLHGDQARACGWCDHYRAFNSLYGRCRLVAEHHPLTDARVHEDFGCNNFDLFAKPYEMEEI